MLLSLVPKMYNDHISQLIFTTTFKIPQHETVIFCLSNIVTDIVKSFILLDRIMIVNNYEVYCNKLAFIISYLIHILPAIISPNIHSIDIFANDFHVY